MGGFYQYSWKSARFWALACKQKKFLMNYQYNFFWAISFESLDETFLKLGM